MSLFHRKRKLSLPFIGFLQAAGLATYCGLVGLLFWRGEQWFGQMDHYFGPLLLLIIFVTSAMISALLVLGYPFILFWDKKQTKEALKLVGCTIGWMIFFILLLILVLIIT